MMVRKWIPLLLLFLVLFPGNGQASASEARTQLESTITAVLQELASPAFASKATRESVLASVETIITQRFDFAAFTARAVGRDWQSFNQDQKGRLTDAFTDLLRETYLNKLTGYNGEKVQYLSEISSTDGKRVEVQTAIVIGKNSIPIGYRLQKNSDWKVYDVIVESLSLTQNFRGQFNSLLKNGDVEALITAVTTKAAEARKSNISR